MQFGYDLVAELAQFNSTGHQAAIQSPCTLCSRRHEHGATEYGGHQQLVIPE